MSVFAHLKTEFINLYEFYIWDINPLQMFSPHYVGSFHFHHFFCCAEASSFYSHLFLLYLRYLITKIIAKTHGKEICSCFLKSVLTSGFTLKALSVCEWYEIVCIKMTNFLSTLIRETAFSPSSSIEHKCMLLFLGPQLFKLAYGFHVSMT